MNATDLTPDIAVFAQQVRAELADLPADEVDDLLDGLEADLAEQALDRGEDFTLPDAVSYAAELRAAAGLPPRADVVRPRTIRERFAAIPARLDRVEARLRDNDAMAWFLDLCGELRPVWWILRGWGCFAVVALVFGVSPIPDASAFLPIALLVGFVLVSVQWGRGRWAPKAWLRVSRTIASVVAVLVLPFAIAYAAGEWSSRSTVYDMDSVQYYPQGMTVDGERVRNIYAYDAEGNIITDVQLFDQDGRPLVTTGSDGKSGNWDVDSYFYGGGGPVPVPLQVAGRDAIWNVYPLRELPSDAGIDGREPDPTQAQNSPFPFAQVPALPSTESVSDETDITETPGPTPAPSEAPLDTTTPGSTP